MLCWQVCRRLQSESRETRRQQLLRQGRAEFHNEKFRVQPLGCWFDKVDSVVTTQAEACTLNFGSVKFRVQPLGCWFDKIDSAVTAQAEACTLNFLRNNSKPKANDSRQN